jgi:hypothetical protein
MTYVAVSWVKCYAPNKALHFAHCCCIAHDTEECQYVLPPVQPSTHWMDSTASMFHLPKSKCLPTANATCHPSTQWMSC